MCEQILINFMLLLLLLLLLLHTKTKQTNKESTCIIMLSEQKYLYHKMWHFTLKIAKGFNGGQSLK